MGPFKLLPCHSGHSNVSYKFAKKLKRSVNTLQFSQKQIGQQTEELLTGQQTNAEGIKRRRLKQLTHYNLVIMHLYRKYISMVIFDLRQAGLIYPWLSLTYDKRD
jgi:hypothetical protein